MDQVPISCRVTTSLRGALGVARPPVRSWFAALVLVSASFTIVGSLVPFAFHARALPEAFSSFCWAMTDRVLVQSRSDGLANVLLGVPLGFSLLGFLCVNRNLSTSQTMGRGCAVLAACAIFAALIEFIQLFVPARTCAGSDVWAQGLGAVLGMSGWFLFGQRFATALEEAAAANGRPGQLLVGYVLILGFIQALPLDFTLSPYQAYYKYRDGHVKLIPFEEFCVPEDRWTQAVELVKLAALYLPVGLLAGRSQARFWALENFVPVALAASALAAGIELGQVLVKGRTTSATDAIVGAAAALGGWLLVKLVMTRRA